VPRVSDQKINEGLKEIGQMITGLNRKIQISYNRGGKKIVEMVPRYQLLSNHCGRRTLVTNLVNQGFDYTTIMAISGHTSLKNFEGYIKRNKVGSVRNLLNEFVSKSSLNT
jgi:hypothetical protein